MVWVCFFISIQDTIENVMERIKAIKFQTGYSDISSGSSLATRQSIFRAGLPLQARGEEQELRVLATKIISSADVWYQDILVSIFSLPYKKALQYDQ